MVYTQNFPVQLEGFLTGVVIYDNIEINDQEDAAGFMDQVRIERI